MVYLLPTLGILFLFIGIAIFAIAYFYDAPRTQQTSLMDSRFLKDTDFWFLHQTQDKRKNTAPNEKSQDDRMEKLLQFNLHTEREQKNQLSTVATIILAGLFLTLLLYLVGGGIVFWHFHLSWGMLTGVKVLFIFLYLIGLFMLVADIAVSFRAHRVGDLFSPSYLHTKYSSYYSPHWDMEESNKALYEEYRDALMLNTEKRRYLTWAKFLFLFIFFDFIILALILLFQYLH